MNDSVLNVENEKIKRCHNGIKFFFYHTVFMDSIMFAILLYGMNFANALHICLPKENQFVYIIFVLAKLTIRLAINENNSGKRTRTIMRT